MAKPDKPNILFIMSDDIGWFNISCNNNGIMGYRIPKLFDLRADPFERGEEAFKYNDWFVEHVPMQYAAQAIVHEWLESFKEFPPRAKAASFTIDQIVEKLMPSG
jgi:hypothetical protein